jgi:hypothetical protein
MFQVAKLVAVAGLLLAVIRAQDKSRDAPRGALSVCDILSDPAKYNGRLVTIRAISEGTDEGWWIGAGKACTAPLITNGYSWPSIIWVQSIGGPQHTHRPDFETDQNAVSKVDREVRRLHIDPKLDRIWLSFTGIFETREFTAKDVGNADGKWRADGFGHLNSAPGQLLLKTVSGLSVERGAAH